MEIDYEDDRVTVCFKDILPGEVFIDSELDEEAIMRVINSGYFNEKAIEKENGGGFGVRLRDGEIFPYYGDEGVYRVKAYLNVKKI